MSRSEPSADDAIIAQAIDQAEIPLIDFAPFRLGGRADRRAVAQQIARACETIGFFYLSGHGVSGRTIEAMFTQSAVFHGLPIEAKRAVLATPEWYRGWVPAPAGQKFSRNSRLFDQYRLQVEWEPAEPRDPLGFDAPNRWPEAMPAFRATAQEYLGAMQVLASELVQAFALALGLPETRLDEYFRKPLSQLSLLRYTPLPDGVAADVCNTVPHTDEGPFTVLAQSPVAGLEVKRRDGSWIAAPPIAGAFTINVGDMMMWWSNGRFLSNQHRVKNRSGGERFSMPFFVSPDREVVVEPLPELLGAGEEPQYRPVLVSEHFARFYARLQQIGPDDYA